MPVSARNLDSTSLQFAEYFPVNVRPYFYALWSKLKDGHICVPRLEIESENWSDVFPGFNNEEDLSEFVSEGAKYTPIVESEGNLYLQRYFKYETTIIEKIKSFLEAAVNAEISADTKKLFKELFPGNETTDWQAVAAAAALTQQFTIITGGPGTGKTRTVAFILALLFSENPELKVALAAPTGKAATRMAESIKNSSDKLPQTVQEKFKGLSPSTIHRLLGSIRNSIYFKHNSENPLPHDVIIIDESSMIDVALFAKLVEAVAPQSKLILLGDKNQLASVEAGSLFGDLCSLPEKLNQFGNNFLKKITPLYESELTPAEKVIPIANHIVELQKSYRFDDSKGIGRLSRIVINEDVNTLKSFMEETDKQVKIDFEYNDSIFEHFVDGFGAFIKEKDIKKAISLLGKCKVLCALREGNNGLYAINKRIESILEKKGLIKCDNIFYHNRPVMITKNNYALGVYNGDTGIIRKNEKGQLRAWIETESGIVDFNPAIISYAETAFAITIHKSQGSEFENVAIILPPYDSPILTKELIYTAITRAKETVLIRTNKEIFTQSITRRVKRGSGLQNRFGK
ncbi:MAG: exodeoxyribonuclease V subunit alpha [Chitinophagaceae bacterium]|nr:exodeoxyribonuclease V subunit alpha [Chitinophagaceae bacterium]